MSGSKNNSSWLLSSFDSTCNTKPSTAKRRRSEKLNDLVNNDPFAIDILPKKKNVSNLSTLLASCEPKNSSELVISRQKQREITDWLECRVKKGSPAALVLSGPSGCGKTMAIKVLAKEHGFDITEWITPIDQIMDENNRIMRQGERFEDFLIRATRYSSVLSQATSRLLLVKELPNAYLDQKESFFHVLDLYFNMGREPIVFVCTDSGNLRLLQTLFAPNVREKFGIDLINVNAVTATSMKNALKRVSSILNTSASHILQVTQQNVDEILSNSIGDIRSALLNLIFTSLKVTEETRKGGNTLREETLGLLHGIGRVINPKRIQEGDSWKFAHDPDELAAYFESHATIFLNFIQENYLNTMRSIDEVNAAATLLSQSDILNSEWRDRNLTKATLSFCTRGIMLINEKPVSGWNPVRKPPSDKIEVKRCLAAAETRWYETLIKPEEKKEKPDCGDEGIIE